MVGDGLECARRVACALTHRRVELVLRRPHLRRQAVLVLPRFGRCVGRHVEPRHLRTNEVDHNIVDRHIRSLRIKLQDGYRHPRFIATVSGHGYRFIPTFSNSGWEVGSTTGEQPLS